MKMHFYELMLKGSTIEVGKRFDPAGTDAVRFWIDGEHLMSWDYLFETEIRTDLTPAVLDEHLCKMLADGRVVSVVDICEAYRWSTRRIGPEAYELQVSERHGEDWVHLMNWDVIYNRQQLEDVLFGVYAA